MIFSRNITRRPSGRPSGHAAYARLAARFILLSALTGCEGGGTSGTGVTSAEVNFPADVGVCGGVIGAGGEGMSGVSVSVRLLSVDAEDGPAPEKVAMTAISAQDGSFAILPEQTDGSSEIVVAGDEIEVSVDDGTGPVTVAVELPPAAASGNPIDLGDGRAISIQACSDPHRIDKNEEQE